jgi:hypothetical protein
MNIIATTQSVLALNCATLRVRVSSAHFNVCVAFVTAGRSGGHHPLLSPTRTHQAGCLPRCSPDSTEHG